MLRMALAVFVIASAWGQPQNEAAGTAKNADRASAYYYYAMARMYAGKGDMQQAVENYKAAIKADPQMPLREELSMIEAGRFSYFRPPLQTFFRPLAAQNDQRPVKADKVVVRMVVTDQYGRYINALKPSDFRVFEDGIPQKLFTFAEGRNPVVLLNDDGTPRPLDNPKSAEEAGKAVAAPPVPNDDAVANSYTITYNPDPSNHNQGFRKIDIKIVSDATGHLRVRHRPGYRPNWPPKPDSSQQ